MYDVLAKFDKDSKEYNEIKYRITCMQGYQQEVIDSIKGIVPKRVPKHWYEYKAVKINDNDTEDEIKDKLYNQKLLSNKKPYFFIYNYDNLYYKYNKYIENNNTNCMIKFGKTVEELLEKKNKTKEEEDFLFYYNLMMPISKEKSLMNRMCWILEKEYSQYDLKLQQKKFDYCFLKRGFKYRKKDRTEIEQIFQKYRKGVNAHIIDNNILNNDLNEEDKGNNNKNILIETFKREIFSINNNKEVVCDILIDICYGKNLNKHFVWDICGDIIIKRLLKLNDYNINIPIISKEKTNTYWQGEYYKIEQIKIEEGYLC